MLQLFTSFSMGKHKGARSLYTSQRDAELHRAFCRAKERLLREKGYVLLSEAVDMARLSGTSRYFISEERAASIISNILKGRKPLQTMSETKNRQFRNLYVQYQALKSQFPNLPHLELVVMACASPAKEFYLTHKAATQILSLIHINHKSSGIISSDQSISHSKKK